MEMENINRPFFIAFLAISLGEYVVFIVRDLGNLKISWIFIHECIFSSSCFISSGVLLYASSSRPKHITVQRARSSGGIMTEKPAASRRIFVSSWKIASASSSEAVIANMPSLTGMRSKDAQK